MQKSVLHSPMFLYPLPLSLSQTPSRVIQWAWWIASYSLSLKLCYSIGTAVDKDVVCVIFTNQVRLHMFHDQDTTAIWLRRTVLQSLTTSPLFPHICAGFSRKDILTPGIYEMALVLS